MFTTTAFTGPVMQDCLRPCKLMTLAAGLLLAAPSWQRARSLRHANAAGARS